MNNKKTYFININTVSNENNIIDKQSEKSLLNLDSLIKDKRHSLFSNQTTSTTHLSSILANQSDKSIFNMFNSNNLVDLNKSFIVTNSNKISNEFFISYYKEKIVIEEKNLIVEKNLSKIINDIANHGEDTFNNENLLKKFYKSKKSINIVDYFNRLKEFLELECSTYLIAYILIDKITNITDIEINHYNIHKLFLACLYISMKLNEDYAYSNEYISKVAGLSIKEIILLERSLLNILNFDLEVSIEEYNRYYDLAYDY